MTGGIGGGLTSSQNLVDIMFSLKEGRQRGREEELQAQLQFSGGSGVGKLTHRRRRTPSYPAETGSTGTNHQKTNHDH